MAKVTSKLQVTVPKAIADRYGIRPGDEIGWVAAGDAIRVVPAGWQGIGADLQSRLKLFDAATERQRRKQSSRGCAAIAVGEAGRGRISTSPRALVDTNVLVYRYDPRFPGREISTG
jgi:AbrB family looped-hinge helix DNA binding protein